MTAPSTEIDDMKSACIAIIRANARAEAMSTSLEWEDIDTALEFARAAMPGEYEKALYFYAQLYSNSENQE